jgi:Domain of unknown function (DUF932)
MRSKIESNNHMSQSSLILHCGASEVQREKLAEVFTPPATDTFQPVGHTEFLNQVESALISDNYKVVSETHALSRNGARYFGLLQLATKDQPSVEAGEWGGSGVIYKAQSSDYGFVVGLRNSHDHAYSASIAIGAHVFVCDNLSFSGEVRLARKHTTFIARDLPGLAARAVGRLVNGRVQQEQRFAAYKGHELGDKDANDLLIRALDARAITGTQIPHVLREWRTPRHPEFGEAKTAWRFFNAITEVAKEKGGIWNLPARTGALHGLLDSAVGIINN